MEIPAATAEHYGLQLEVRVLQEPGRWVFHGRCALCDAPKRHHISQNAIDELFFNVHNGRAYAELGHLLLEGLRCGNCARAESVGHRVTHIMQRNQYLLEREQGTYLDPAEERGELERTIERCVNRIKELER